ncbi:sugar ABC transporter ATP-binding protein [Lactobacillus plantarum] [Lactiplantibacillus mudanjiangensis]|nr:sugar ABC transporter ATP-binding protein [Lactobacillus plantarum] [Lactiplantibacillus mudanjiangensis]
MFFFFFFQAEDGIRDSSTSRGLGDVYKRQIYVTHDQVEAMTMADRIVIMNDGKVQQLGLLMICITTVSYTHLTLPTKRIV